MDQKDKLILEKLKEDANKPIAQLAKELKMPRTTIANRIKKMIESGIIKKFTIAIDYEKVGKPITAFILISFLPNYKISQRQLANLISKIENVYEVYIISGEWDLLLKVRGRSMEEIGKLVLDKIRRMEGVGKTVTCTCFHVVKEEI